MPSCRCVRFKIADSALQDLANYRPPMLRLVAAYPIAGFARQLSATELDFEPDFGRRPLALRGCISRDEFSRGSQAWHSTERTLAPANLVLRCKASLTRS